MPVAAPKIVIRLGSHAEKEYVIKLARFLDGLIVGANLFEATPGATASLLLRTGFENTELYVDPMTYAYGTYIDPASKRVCKDLDWIKSDQIRRDTRGKKRTVRDFKRSYKALANRLGPPVDQAVQTSVAVTPAAFEDNSVITEFCSNVLQYQLSRMSQELEQDNELRDHLNDVPRPKAVFAPYFYVEPNNSEDWIKTNLRLMEAAAALNDVHVPVHGILCADCSHLTNEAIIRRLAEALPNTGIAGIWLWFSGFFEESAETATLKAYRDLVETLGSRLEVHAMHGGLLSLLLSKFGMSGVSHGIGYGEQKNVVPIIGQSIPMVRYYLPPMARRLGVPDIELTFNVLGIHNPNDFHQQVCSCAVCKGIVASSLDEFSAFGDMHFSRSSSKRRAQTPAAAKRCRFHFLLARLRERDEICTLDLADILLRLRSADRTWGTQPSLKSSAQHLARWVATLEA